MKKFAQLFRVLDQSTKTNSKIKALFDYFDIAENPDKVCAISLFFDIRPKRTVITSQLRKWSAEASELPMWLFEESYQVVGDLTETISLIVPNPSLTSERSLAEWMNVIQELKNKAEAVKKENILAAWKSLDQDERFVFNKLITGGFRIGVSPKIVINALSLYTGIEESKITHRLMGKWDPSTTTFEELVLESNPREDLSKPYPFYLGSTLDVDPEDLGDPAEWTAERKWDGVRVQLILRENEYYLWSRGKDLLSEKFPELDILKGKVDKDVVIDGALLPFKDERILNYDAIQTRIGRKKVTKKQLLEVPVVMIAYDLIEYDGEDMRDRPLEERRAKLEEIVINVASNRLFFSDNVKFGTWEELASERSKSRINQCVGLILKKKNSTYKDGRKKGDWWKWKMDPFTIDAVMIYAQRGSGQQSKLYTDFTFAVKNGDALVPFTKTSSGLTDEEFEEITLFVKNNTREKFGPVRGVNPELVFEIAFDGIIKSSRHKSGISLRFPRIKRWRKDKLIDEINTLKDLNKILVDYEGNTGAGTLF